MPSVGPDYRLFLTEAQKDKIIKANLDAAGLGQDIPFSTSCIVQYYLALVVFKIYGAAVVIFNPDVHLVSTPLAWLIAVVYLVTIPNIWPMSLWFFREHATIDRYLFHYLIISPRFWMFILDQFLFGIPGFFLLASVSLSPSFIGLLVFVVLNFTIFLLIVLFNTQYEKDEDDPWTIKSTSEEATSPDNQLSILESDGHSIILKNVDAKAINGRYTIIRTVGKIFPTSYDIHFNLETPLQPGIELKLVPEPQKKDKKCTTEPEEAANVDVVQLRGYRSFGTHRGAKIKTEAFLDGNKTPCVTRTDIYELGRRGKKVDEPTVTMETI